MNASIVRNPEGGKYRITYDDSIRGVINGGGPEYIFNTYQGDIYIRRAK